MLLGGQRPRIQVLPDFTSSLGEEAIKLAELAGLTLDQWQADAVTALLGVRQDGKWACFEYAEIVSRQNGKGSILEARTLAGLFLLDEKLIMWSAHEYKTAQEAFLRVRDLIRNLEMSGVIAPDMVNTISGAGHEQFEILETGQRAKFIARSKSSGRGFSGDLNIIDEAFAYDTLQQAALLPTVSARPNAQLIYASTPPLDGAASEVLYKLRNRATSGVDNESLGYRDWGAAGALDEKGLKELDFNDRELWAATNPAYNIRITEETIKRERQAFGKIDFARERLGVWPREAMNGGGAIDITRWHTLVDPGSIRVGDCAIGIDIAPHREFAAIGLYSYGADGQMGHMHLINYGFGTGWIMARLIQLRTDLDPIAWAMGKGTFASLEIDLRNANFAVPESAGEFKRGDVLVMGGPDMSAACGHMVDAVRDGTMRVKPDPDAPEILESAVAGAHIREGVDSIAWSRKGSADITPLVAVTCARYGFTSKVDSLHKGTPFFASWR